MPSADTSENGHTAERAAARKYGLELDREVPHADLRAGNGVLYSVKSATHTRASGAPGKFRFWKDYFNRLPEGRSAVILVLTPSVGTESDRPLKVQKIRRSDVADVIEARGGWYDSGHADRGEQHKLPWPEVLDL